MRSIYDQGWGHASFTDREDGLYFPTYGRMLKWESRIYGLPSPLTLPKGAFLPIGTVAVGEIST